MLGVRRDKVETQPADAQLPTGADLMAFPDRWHRSVPAVFLDAIEKNREPRVSGADGSRFTASSISLLR